MTDNSASDSEVERQRGERYLTDPVYHARVHAAAMWLEDWDFRHGAGEGREWYVEQAMGLLAVVDEAATPLSARGGLPGPPWPMFGG